MILDDGENLGVIPTHEALKKAEELDLDLVIIAEKTNPPVAKILDFNKYLYEERKKESAAKAKSKKSELKEFRFGPSIDEGDLMQRVGRAKEFIEDGNRVKFSVKMKGREAAHPQIAFEKINRVIKELAETAKVEKEPTLTGNIVDVFLVGK